MSDMPGIKVHHNDSFDEAYRKFKKQVDRNLIVTEKRARKNFETKTEKRKKEKIAARKKILKKLYMLRRYEARL
jgi:small subunit ribosomal protein S21